MNEIVEVEIQNARRNGAILKDEDVRLARQARLPGVVTRSRALDRTNSLGAVEAIGAGLSTDLDGVEAGISVAPGRIALDLLGEDNKWARALVSEGSVSLATLKGGQSRVGADWQFTWPLSSDLKDLDGKDCRRTEGDVRKQVEQLVRGPLKRICKDIVEPNTVVGVDAKDRQWVARAKQICGFSGAGNSKPAPTATLVKSVEGVLYNVRALTKKRTIGPLSAEKQADMKALDEYSTPTETGCGKTKTIIRRVRISKDRQWRVVFPALSVDADFFPFRFGFQETDEATGEPKALEMGEVKRFMARAQLAVQSRGFQIVLGGSGGAIREETFTDPQLPLVGLNVSAAYRLLGFDADGFAVLSSGASKSGFVTVGANILADFVPVVGTTRTQGLYSASLSGFLDTRINDTLAFRIVVPFRVSNKALAPDSGYQLSVPVFATTVISGNLEGLLLQ